MIVNRELLPHEYEQLVILHMNGLTFAGDTLSHGLVNSLVKKGLAATLDGDYVVTLEGEKLLKLWNIIFRNLA